METQAKPPIIIWFTNNLRLSDNYTLQQAAKTGAPFIPVYILEPRHLITTEYGFRRMGSHRYQFLKESVEDLSQQCQQASGAPLCIFQGYAEVVLADLAAKTHATAVYVQAEDLFEEERSFAKVEKALAPLGCVLNTVADGSLIHLADLPFPIKNLPDVFTSFRKKVEKEWQVRPLCPTPSLQAFNLAHANNNMPCHESLNLPLPVADERKAMHFTGGATAAAARLQHYFWETQALATYKETRNGLIGADYSSKFSPWLATGCISAREIYWEIKRFEQEVVANESTYWLVFELLWRDYFRFSARKHGSRIFLPEGPKGQPQLSKLNHPTLDKWIQGQTGDDFVDANMRELLLTGFMSNRGRQNVASYLVKNQKQPWLAGAAWFESALMDYDPYSNYGNWSYVAGTGSDPREDRYFNTAKQASMYDAEGAYRKLWL